MKMGRQKSKQEFDTYLCDSELNKPSMNSQDTITANQAPLEESEDEHDLEEDKIIIKDNTYIIKGKEGRVSSKGRRQRKGGSEANSNIRQRLYDTLSCKLRERNKRGKVVKATKQRQTLSKETKTAVAAESESETESSSTYSDTSSDSDSESDSEVEDKPGSKSLDSFLTGPIRVIDGKVITAGAENSVPLPPYVPRSRSTIAKCNSGMPKSTGAPVMTNLISAPMVPPTHMKPNIPPVPADVPSAPPSYPQMFCNLSIPHMPTTPLTPVLSNTLQPDSMSSNYTLTNLNKPMMPVNSHEGFKVALPKGFSLVASPIGAVMAPMPHHVPIPNQPSPVVPAPVQKKPMPLIPPLDKVGAALKNVHECKMEYEEEDDSDTSSSSSDEDDDTFSPAIKQEDNMTSGESDNERVDSPTSLVIDSDADRDETWEPKMSKETRRRRSLQMRSEKTLKKHANKPIKCDICLRGFDKEIRLRRHKQIYHARPFSCYICNKQFKFEASLKEHKKVHGSTDIPVIKRPLQKPLSPPPPPPVVPAKTLQTKESKNEISTIFDCHFCSRKYDSKLALQKHLKARHGNRQYLCSVCGRAFKFQASYKEHMNSHGWEKERMCEVCSRQFCDYGCNICGRRLGSPLDQSLHMALHSDPTMLECKTCGKPFHEPKILQEHGKTHSGLVTCGCVVCWKCIDNKGVMKRHLVQVHADEGSGKLFNDHIGGS